MGKGEATREAIVVAARQLIARKGFQGTSIQKVADTIGLSQSAVMHHFPSKVELFNGILGHMVAENDAIANKYYDPKDGGAVRLLKFFEVNYDWAIEYDYNAQIMTCLFHFASFDPKFKALYSEILTGSRAKVLEYVYAGQREGSFVLGESPAAVSAILHDALLGLILISATTTTGRSQRASSRRKWQALIHGLTGYGTQI